MKDRTRPTNTVRRVLVVAAILVVLLLVAAALLAWNSTRLNDAERQVQDQANHILELAAQGRYDEVVDLMAPTCRRASNPLTVEDLDFFFHGEKFGYDLARVKLGATSGQVSGSIKDEGYAHIVGVYFERVDQDAPWEPCSIGVSGYT